MMKTYIVFAVCTLLMWGACKRAQVHTDIQTSRVSTQRVTKIRDVRIPVLATRDLILQGGNKQYTVSVENEKIAQAAIFEDTLRVTGLWEGKTFATILSHGTRTKVNIHVVASSLAFSQDSVEVPRMEVVKYVTLGGGGREVWLTVDSLAPVDTGKIDVMWENKTGQLHILGIKVGTVHVTAKSGSEQKRLKVSVIRRK